MKAGSRWIQLSPGGTVGSVLYLAPFLYVPEPQNVGIHKDLVPTISIFTGRVGCLVKDSLLSSVVVSHLPTSQEGTLSTPLILRADLWRRYR